MCLSRRAVRDRRSPDLDRAASVTGDNGWKQFKETAWEVPASLCSSLDRKRLSGAPPRAVLAAKYKISLSQSCFLAYYQHSLNQVQFISPQRCTVTMHGLLKIKATNCHRAQYFGCHCCCKPIRLTQPTLFTASSPVRPCWIPCSSSPSHCVTGTSRAFCGMRLLIPCESEYSM